MFFKGEYSFLSNFYPSPVRLMVEQDEWYFQTAENAYQAAKSQDPEVWKWMQRIPAWDAKRHGRKLKLRPNWDQVKLPIMTEIVGIKFRSNPPLMRALKATGDIPIIEDNNWGDTYWGVCNGVGENHLGKILMDIRSLNSVEEKVEIELKS